MWSVSKILETKARRALTHAERIDIKSLGPPRPVLIIDQEYKLRGKVYQRKFNANMYCNDWICGCDEKNAFFCFVCLLINNNNPREVAWSARGVKDLIHLSEKIKKHMMSPDHLNNYLSFSLLGGVDIQYQLDNAYRQSIIDHNRKVEENRYILSKLIDAIKFCGVFELALRGRDESKDSSNPDIYSGLVDLMAEIDTKLKEDIDKADKRPVFGGLSKTIQNDLLNSIFSVCFDLIKKEVEEADFIAIMADGTTDVSSKHQITFVVRYFLNGVIWERFLGFIEPADTKAVDVANLILHQLEKLNVHHNPQKLIGQCYDGASVMIGEERGVQALIAEKYPSAAFIHCYAHHQLNSVMEKAASKADPQVRIFFANLEGIARFFSTSPQRTKVLDEIVKRRLPRGSAIRWNFNSRLVSTMSTHRDDLAVCFKHILESADFDGKTIQKTFGFQKTLEDEHFNYWLTFLNKIMPHCDILFDQLQKRQLDCLNVRKCINSFRTGIEKVKNSLQSLNSTDVDSGLLKRRKIDRIPISEKVCDLIISEIETRFSDTNHLAIEQLFNKDSFIKYTHMFPNDYYDNVVAAYKVNGEKLKQELVTIYAREDFSTASGPFVILQFFTDNNLLQVFSECAQLLKILCTLPVTIVECENSFSILKRIKTFQRNTVQNERLSALAMCSVEKDLIKTTPGFNKLVIEHFSKSTERRRDFLFKSVN